MDLGNRQGFKSLIKTMLKKMSNSWKKGYDQHLLTQYIWPAVKKTACVHDSYLCNSYPAPNNRPWPTKRKNEPGNFAASNGVAQISYTCPKNCRPKDHLDWTKC
ncbi:uncharacterized protein LOC111717469 [Eurytemora carolleeae]|uniref:uncharacterized protein LOC111717469 n=1 Tax=Eurytemora carolleeae TaxID=1294199 RepID=UPI000C782950|nr:uncharacterized protein LOC111717469 [Eurytemora carolleeae]|eukprot:XP_023348738.1 uncharacterized protein LOC111717469 [Eurytemora affinis]